MIQPDEDALLQGIELRWTCGVVAGAMCAHCYMELARKAHELATENVALRDRLEGERPA